MGSHIDGQALRPREHNLRRRLEKTRDDLLFRKLLLD